MPTQPLVSIVIPTHRPEHFRNALMCSLAQTYRNIEIIVSDNSGGDAIAEMCAPYPQVIYRKNVDGQASSNIAMGLGLATGEFIKYLFDDDLLYPHCIESMLGWLGQFSAENQAQIGLITSNRHLVNEQGIVYGELREESLTATTLMSGAQVRQRLLSTLYNFVGEFSTILFRRALIDSENPLSIFSAYGETCSIGLIDVPLYLQLMEKSHLLYIPHSLSIFRKHSNSGSNVATSPMFHTVVTDWLRLTRAAYRAGALDAASALSGAKVQLSMNKHFMVTFPEAMAKTQIETQNFLTELESTPI